MREVLPSQATESDLALRMRLKLMAKVIDEVGQERFHRAVEKAISISHSRYHVTVARIRECAGLQYVPPRPPAAVAWEFVVQVFLDHVRTDGNGNYHLEPKYQSVDGKVTVTDPPEVPPAILRAVRSMGGWAAIAEAWPEFISQKFRDFKDLYDPGEVQGMNSGKQLINGQESEVGRG